MYIFCTGRYAEGRSCHGMDHYANKRKQCSEVPASHSPPRHGPDTTSTLHFDVEGTRDDTLIGLVMMNSVLHQVKDSTLMHHQKKHIHQIPQI